MSMFDLRKRASSRLGGTIQGSRGCDGYKWKRHTVARSEQAKVRNPCLPNAPSSEVMSGTLITIRRRTANCPGNARGEIHTCGD